MQNSKPHRFLRPKQSSFGRKKTPGTPRDPLGLSVVHAPEESRKFDIVFVHGLGGTSQLSWSKNKDLEKFWPSKYLPLELDLCDGRILTFGYDANIVHNASNKLFSVFEFAKDLLFELKYGKDENTEDLDMGAVRSLAVIEYYELSILRYPSSSSYTLWEDSYLRK